jgi:hypothetical protein
VRGIMADEDKALRMRISWDGPGDKVKVVFWDKDGKKHNITDKFVSSTGTTTRRVVGADDIKSILSFRTPRNGLGISLDFVPKGRNIVIDMPEDVCNQLMQIL